MSTTLRLCVAANVSVPAFDDRNGSQNRLSWQTGDRHCVRRCGELDATSGVGLRYYRRMTRVKALLALLGVEHPIIQAPMAGVSTPELAAAVSNSGGLGSLGIGASNVEQARSMIRATRALTPRAFNVNLFCHRRATPDGAREAEWLAYLAPRFAEFGARAPAELREIYKTFVGNGAMVPVLDRKSVV